MLSGGEGKILIALSESGGEMLQSELVVQSGLSRSRTSEILSSLEKKSLVSRHPLGKNYLIVLETEAHRTGRKKLRLGFTRSAEYPFLVPFRKNMRNDFGVEIRFQIYDNGLDVARDLSLSRLDLGIAPILSSFMFCSLGAPFRIIAPAGSGGSSIVSTSSEHALTQPRVATTKLSTMELLFKSSIREHFLPDKSRAVYASSPPDIVNGILSNRFDAACIWEPYATLLAKERGLARIVSYKEIGEHICCVLSAGNHLSDRMVSNISSMFGQSISEFLKGYNACLKQYSLITGFDEKLMREVSPQYTYPEELETRVILNQFELARVDTPSPSTIEEMIRRIN